MPAYLRSLLVLAALGIAVSYGMANPAPSPRAKTSQELAAEARTKASEALADSLMPPQSKGGINKSDNPNNANRPGNPGKSAPETGEDSQGPNTNGADRSLADPSGPSAKSQKQPQAVANLFTIPGDAAVAQARAAGYHFSPAGAAGARDGIHTTASQYLNAVTSEIDGNALRQFRPPTNWAVASSSNKFYMFVEADLKPAPLAAGWKIRGINLKGANWKWVDGPRTGAPSASFVIAITAGKLGPAFNEVRLDELVLEGPPGETNWRNAFAPKIVAEPKPK